MGPISNIHVWQLSVRVSLWTLYRERHRSPHTYWVLIEPWPNRYVAFFVQRSQSCHTHSISPSYLLLSNQRKKQKSHCAALLLLFGILHFPSNIIHQIFFSPTFFVLLFISNFLFSHPCCLYFSLLLCVSWLCDVWVKRHLYLWFLLCSTLSYTCGPLSREVHRKN